MIAFVAFDLETTGLNPQDNKIVEIGAVRFEDGRVTGTFQTFVDPETTIPDNIQKITGVTPDMVAGAPKEAEAVRKFLAFVGDSILVAHNAKFDKSFVCAVTDRCDIGFYNDVYDSLALGRLVNPRMSHHRLSDLVRVYNICKDEGSFVAHRASDDAEMCGRVFVKMLPHISDRALYRIKV